MLQSPFPELGDELSQSGPQRGVKPVLGAGGALTLHGRRMINAFLRLKNDEMRGAVADLVQTLAR
jgi:hypothetical protein